MAIAIAISLHLLGTIVWVGGMFFAHMALRPAAEELFEPPQRLPLMLRVLDRFFVWVWAAIGLILASGYWIFFAVFQGVMGLYAHLMQGTGLLMVGLFMYIYFVPYKRMAAALRENDYPRAGAQLAVIRRIILTNLLLGLITAVLGGAGKFV
jgi:uncharacterized membrane protein